MAAGWTLIVMGSGGGQSRRVRLGIATLVGAGLLVVAVLTACLCAGWYVGELAAGPAAGSLVR